MALNEPAPDQRMRSKSQPNMILADANGFRRPQKTNNKLTTESTNQNEPKTTSPVPSILLEGEVLDFDPNVPEIHRAVSTGNLTRLKELIESGESVNVPDEEGWPPLHTAIKSGHYDCAQLLIKNGATDSFERHKEEYSTRLNISSRLSKGRLFSF